VRDSSTFHSRLGRASARTGAAALLVALAGCTGNPLTARPGDYGRVIDASRLRSVDPLSLPEAPAGAAEPSASESLAALQARIAGAEQVSLAIEECRAAALANNLNLRVSLVDPALAGEALREQEAAFEALFFTNATYSNTDSPTASSLASAQQEFAQISPGVTIPLRTGGSATVTLPLTRNETNNSFSTLNPSYTSDLELTLSQPLLRGAGRHASTQAIRIASYNRQTAEARTTLAVINELANVDRAYWRLYQSREELAVTQTQYELAVAQLQRAERQEKTGRVGEIEVVRAQAGVAARLDAIIQAQSAVLTRQRDLKRRINVEGLDVDSGQALLPGTPPNPVRYALDPSALAAQAVESRMDMLEVELQLLADASNIDLRRNQTLPRLNADLTYRINGLGESLGDASEVLAENNFEDWSAGLRLEVPIGNEAARARLRQAMFTRLQRLSTREGRAQTIRQEVFDACDRIEAAWQRIMAARQSVVLNRRTLEAEERQFDVGRSTSTDVLDASARLADAQIAEIRAIVEYQVAQIDLATATGSLLGASRVLWTPVALTEPLRAE